MAYFVFAVSLLALLMAVVFLAVVIRSRCGGGESRRPRRNGQRGWTYEDPMIRRAGDQGEAAAVAFVRPVLRGGDVLLTNVSVEFENKPTELDLVILNPNGLFIVEVKNYNGRLIGDVDDYEWRKLKMTPGGAVYEKPAKNPIKQVKRQRWILANYLRQNGARVWVNGYVLFIQGNCPVNDPCVLTSAADLDARIHTPARETLSDSQIGRIRSLLRP